ncbi:MAG: hypothetical protein UU76_C0027G0007 [Parcubacteria group bacterium GW2011_GWC1_41_7]|nr:MAG: hypothetical protein UU76_C0027G0007 [Parcubacteria group bacterium GW2011_GWC1_41_7]
MKKGYCENIEKLTRENTDFRRVLYTAMHSQLVAMSLVAGEDIGVEIHDTDQFFRIEEGTGTFVIDGVEYAVEDGSAMVVPAGAEHNVINTGSIPMKLYTIYSPSHHQDGTVHKTKLDALAADEHFDGTTTE